MTRELTRRVQGNAEGSRRWCSRRTPGMGADRAVRCASVIAVIALASARLAVGASTREHEAPTAASYVYVATVRKDGTQSRAVPVWFIATRDDDVLIDTNTDSWKARRIRRGSPV